MFLAEQRNNSSRSSNTAYNTAQDSTALYGKRKENQLAAYCSPLTNIIAIIISRNDVDGIIIYVFNIP